MSGMPLGMPTLEREREKIYRGELVTKHFRLQTALDAFHVNKYCSILYLKILINTLLELMQL
jgi:hypothetical protein